MTDWPLQKYDPGAPTPNTPEPLCVCVWWESVCVCGEWVCVCVCVWWVCVCVWCVCVWVCVCGCGVWRGVEWDQKQHFQSPDH